MRGARAILPLVGLLLGGGREAGSQISPGPLARAHAKLEGATNCVQCHGLKKEPMSQRCLACHREVGWLMEQERGLHARERNGAKRECASCHPDHAGAGFALLDWGEGGRARFDHKRTGWMLEGKHLNAKCESCHKEALRHSPAATLSPRVTGAGWMGLEPACAACHDRDDVHRRALGQNCERCHDANDWKHATWFDHARSSYPLTGKHADVACDKCHKAARFGLRPDSTGRVVGRFKPIEAGQCSDCHADPHKGRLSSNCSQCHNTRGFAVMRQGDFNHALTRYALTGQHRTVPCEACHGVKMARRTPAFANCGDCHADAHYGRATLLGRPADCAACHRVEGFAPSTYTVAQHATISFALLGRHAAVKCGACHAASDSAVRATRRVVRRVELRPAAAACGSCHADAHDGELSRSDSRGVCTACHTVAGWAPSTYTTAQHATLILVLDGAHAVAPCRSCHPAQLARPGTARAGRTPAPTVSLRVPGGNCESCHVDPHFGRYGKGSPHEAPAGCRTCHDTRHFAPAILGGARHAALGFPLDGAHRAIPCRDCHKELGGTPARSTLRQAGMPMALMPLRFDAPRRTSCGACHADPHGGQFTARPAGAACDACHEVAQWTGASRFNHDRDASFPLAGAHQRVPCASCHVRAAQSGGTGIRVQYRPLPTACEGCHAADLTKRKIP